VNCARLCGSIIPALVALADYLKYRFGRASSSLSSSLMAHKLKALVLGVRKVGLKRFVHVRLLNATDNELLACIAYTMIL